MSIFEQRESGIRDYCRVYPVVFDQVTNARQIDEEDKQYIDFFAGRKVLGYFEDNELMTEIAEKSAVMAKALAPLEKDFSEITLREKGTVLGLDVGSSEKAKAIVDGCFAAGLLFASCGTDGSVIKSFPPLTTPNDDLQEGLDILLRHTNTVMGAIS